MHSILEKILHRTTSPHFSYSRRLQVNHKKFDDDLRELLEPLFNRRNVNPEQLHEAYSNATAELDELTDQLNNIPRQSLDMLLTISDEPTNVSEELYHTALRRVSEVSRLQIMLTSERDVLRLEESFTNEDVARSYISRNNSELDVETLTAFMNEFPTYDFYQPALKRYVQFIQERRPDYLTPKMEEELQPLLTDAVRKPLLIRHSGAHERQMVAKTALDTYHHPIPIEAGMKSLLKIGNVEFSFHFEDYEDECIRFRGYVVRKKSDDSLDRRTLFEPLALQHGNYEKTDRGIRYDNPVVTLDIAAEPLGYSFIIDTAAPMVRHHNTASLLNDTFDILNVMIDTLK